MSMLSFIILLALSTSSALGGTLCPPRESIYPCSCANIHQSKKIIHTVVSCHRLKDSDVLKSMLHTLRTMQIDQFHLYDSFWHAERRVLPVNWWTLLKIREMEIVDTDMSDAFGCEEKVDCVNKNTHTTRFTAINISTTERITSLCKAAAGNAYPWTGCMRNLKQFHYSHGGLSHVGPDLFPRQMTQLILLNLTHNKISKIEKAAFKNLLNLAQLDLSNNVIEYVDFISQKTSLKYLDLSWNKIQSIGDLFVYTTFLGTLNLKYNEIVLLPKKDWEKAPNDLTLDLRDNPIHCDCDIRWINSTFLVHAIIQGECASPDEYETMPLRRASRFLSERCDDEGKIGTRKRSSTQSFVF